MDRKLRLQALLGLLKTAYCGGKAAELARRIETDASYVNRLFYAPDKAGAKGIGPDVMDKATKAFGLPRGFWEMEPDEAGRVLAPEPHPTNMGETEIAATDLLSLPASVNEKTDVVIRQYQTGGAMGHGVVLEEQPGIIKEWRVSDDWLRLNVPHFTAKKNLAIVTGFGPSMKPMFNPGDPLLVDGGITTADSDGVYFFRIGTAGFVKQLQRIPQGRGIILRAKSYNPLYDPFDITPDMDFQVFGKVLTVWRSEQH